MPQRKADDDLLYSPCWLRARAKEKAEHRNQLALDRIACAIELDMIAATEGLSKRNRRRRPSARKSRRAARRNMKMAA